jgi:PAS domain S-box-containing protein
MSAVPAPQTLPPQPPDPLAHPGAEQFRRALRDLAGIAALACETPFATISLADGDIEWCRGDRASRVESPAQLHRLHEYTLRSSGLVEIPDASADPRFPAATGFYAGVALVDAGGAPLGTLAVLDDSPRQLTAAQRATLEALASAVLAHLSLSGELANFRAVADHAPVAIYRTDPGGTMTYVNHAYRRIFGLAPDDHVAEWPRYVHAEDREQLQADWDDFCRHPRPIHFSYRTHPPGGVLAHYSERCVPIPGAAAYIGTISDVTELVSTRTELQRAETLFRNTFEQAPIGIVYADRYGRLLRCNPAFTKLLGFASEDLDRWTLKELTYGEDRAMAASELSRLWRGELPAVDIEKRYRRVDGTVTWVRSSTTLVHEGDGRPEYSVEFIRDISLRKGIEGDLLQNQALLEAIVDKMPVALLTCDAYGNISRYNRAAEELLSISPQDRQTSGRPRGYPLGATVLQADGVTPVPADQRPLARALRGEETRNMELVVIPTGAAPRTTVSNAVRLVDPAGHTIGAVSVIQDVTESKQAELELERVHQQLIDASRQAGMAEIATNVLHNVGNVLNSVNVSANLLADRLKQAKTAGLSQVAALLQEHSADLAAFIAGDARGRQLPLYLARLAEQLHRDQQVALEELASLRNNIEHIKHTVTMQQTYAKRCGVADTVAVGALVDDCIRINIAALTRHGVAVIREIEDMPPIVADRHKVLQVLVNLVRNAKHACQESPGNDRRVCIRVNRQDDQVRFAVIDNGVGIAPENMSRLFTHGFTTRATGHGFGLHSGALAARELGGSLTAYSEGVGHGATFILELPRGGVRG